MSENDKELLDMIQAGVRSGELTMYLADDTDKIWELRVPGFQCDPLEHKFEMLLSADKFSSDDGPDLVVRTFKLELEVQIDTMSLTQVGVLVGDQVIKLEGLEDNDGNS